MTHGVEDLDLFVQLLSLRNAAKNATAICCEMLHLTRCVLLICSSVVFFTFSHFHVLPIWVKQVIAPGAARRYAPADGSLTRSGSKSVRGWVRSPHVAKLQAASVPIASGSCAPRAAGTDGWIAVSPYAPPPYGGDIIKMCMIYTVNDIPSSLSSANSSVASVVMNSSFFDIARFTASLSRPQLQDPLASSSVPPPPVLH